MATVGKFTITSRANENFKYEGYSKQCEVMFSDYMSWCAKGKAPKLIQAEYDANNAHPPKALFEIEITPMPVEDFEKTTNKKVARPTTVPADFKPKSIDSMMPVNAPGTSSKPHKLVPVIPDIDWNEVYEEYSHGGKVKLICDKYKIGVPTFYHQMDKFIGPKDEPATDSTETQTDSTEST